MSGVIVAVCVASSAAFCWAIGPPLGHCADTDGNGFVDVDDLLNVILDWGTDGLVHNSDVDGSGVVDADDLVAVILAWGELDDRDCNGNGVPDWCDITADTSTDCDGNGIPDECELEGNDCNGNGVPDECETDCNGNGVPDDCEAFEDCNGNGVPDECDTASGSSPDCNANGVPDDCESDCNCNGLDDALDIAGGTSTDCNADGVPDECQAPHNDVCGSSMTIGTTIEFSTCGAGTEGPDEPECPIQADVWFRFLASCDGTVTVTVEADYVAAVAAYPAPCPSGPGAVIACSEGQISYAVNAGTLYRLRVGSLDGTTGGGTITVTCE